MRKTFLSMCLLSWALAAVAQTDVTTTGGTAKTIPEFSGSTTIVNSPLSIDSNGGLLVGSDAYVAGANNFFSGLVNFTSACCSIDATHAGYGAWLNYNGYFNGSDWIQPEGELATYMYTSNWHAGGWAWYANAATQINNGTFTPTQVASMDGSGDFSMNGKLTVGTGVVNSGGGLKHLRFQGCTLTNQGNNILLCNQTVSWNGSFADTNYTVVCNTLGGFNPSITTKSASGLTLQFDTQGLENSLSPGEVDCIAMHD